MFQATIITNKTQSYIALWNVERIQIYGAQAFDQLQSIKNLYSDIMQVIPTQCGGFYVLTDKELFYYALIITARKDIVWRRIAGETFDRQYTQVIECLNYQESLIMLYPHGLTCLTLNRKEQEEFVRSVEMSPNWNVGFRQEILKIDISEDCKHVVLLTGDNKVYVSQISRIEEFANKNIGLDSFTEIDLSGTGDQAIIDIQFLKTYNYEAANVTTVYKNNLLVISKRQAMLYQESYLNSHQGIDYIELCCIQTDTDIVSRVSVFGKKSGSGSVSQGIDQFAHYYKNTKGESVDVLILNTGDGCLVYEIVGLGRSSMDAQAMLVNKLKIQPENRVIGIVVQPGSSIISLLTKNSATCNISLLAYDCLLDKEVGRKFVKFSKLVEQLYFQKDSDFILLRTEGKFSVYTLDKNTLRCGPEMTTQAIPLKNSSTSDPIVIPSKVVYHCNTLYWVQKKLFNCLQIKGCQESNVSFNVVSVPFHKESIREIFCLFKKTNTLYLIMDGDVVRFNTERHSLEVVTALMPFGRVLKLEYNSSNYTLLVKHPKWYTLNQIEWSPMPSGTLAEPRYEFRMKQIRKSSRHLIYGGGYWVEIYESEVVFGRGLYKVGSFNIANFLGSVSKQHDIKVLYYKILHLTGEIFALQIQNYIFFLSAYFDKRKQRHVVSVVKKSQYSQDYLFIRLSRSLDPSSFQLCYDRGYLCLKTAQGFLNFGRYLGETIGQDDPTRLTDTISYTINVLRRPTPMHHPRFLDQLFLVCNFIEVQTILQKIYNTLLQKHTIESDFSLDLDDYLQLSKSEANSDKKVIIKILGKPPVEDRVGMLKSLQQIIVEQPNRINLSKNNHLLLTSAIEFVIYRIENSRSLDFFSTVFISQTKTLWANKSRVLNTRQLCWILNSNNKDEAFEALIEEPLRQTQETLTWKMLRKFCAVIWYENTTQIKKWVQRMALGEYKKSQDPFDCLLWYIILSKKNILMALFKKCLDQVKTYQFLARDFTQQNHKVAASKNAYALLSKKRYEHAIGFFLLGGWYDEALSVCLNQLQDIQLALLICRLTQGEWATKAVKNIYRKHFIETGQVTNDIWIKHIGHYLLGEYVESYNCLFQENFDEERVVYQNGYRILCDTWKPEFEPQLSSFHPSVIMFEKKIRDSFRVKRELQEYQQLQQQKQQSSIFDDLTGNSNQNQGDTQVVQKTLKPNEQLHLMNSIDYYLQMNLPTHAISLIRQQVAQEKISISVLSRVWRLYVDQLVVHSLGSLKTSSNLRRIQQLCIFLELNPEEVTHYYLERLKELDAGELLLEFYLQTHHNSEIQKYLAHYADQFKKHLLNPSTPNKVETRDWYAVLIHFMHYSKNIIQQICSSKVTADEKQRSKSHINRLKALVYIAHVILNIRAASQNHEIVKLTLQYITAIVNPKYNTDELPISTLVGNDYFWKLLERLPQRRTPFETPKTSKRMDILEQAFRKPQNQQKDVLQIPTQPQIFYWILAKLLLESLILKISTHQHMPFIRQIFEKQANYLSSKLQVVTSSNIVEVVEKELWDVLRSGEFAWNKYPRLSENPYIDGAHAIELLTTVDAASLLTKKYPVEAAAQDSTAHNYRSNSPDYAVPSDLSSQIASMRQLLFKQPVEIFKTKSDPIKSFVLNQSAPCYEAVVLFKKTLRKVDIGQSLIARIRSQDGTTLLDEDSPTSAIESPLVSIQPQAPSRNPFLNNCIYLLTKPTFPTVSAAQRLLPHFRPRNTESTLLNQAAPAISSSEDMNCIVSHPKLPVFFIGNRSAVEVYSYQNMKPTTRFSCPLVSQITKIKVDRAGQLLGFCDTDGSFMSIHLDTGLTSLSFKKSGCTEFTYLHSNLVALYNPKDMTLHAYDPLVSSSRNPIFRDKLSAVSNLVYSAPTFKLFAARKSEISVFDIRKGFLTRIDAAGEVKSLEISSSGSRLLVGNSYGQLRILSLDGDDKGTSKPFGRSKRPGWVEEIQVREDSVFGMSNEGVISLVANVL